MKKKVSKVYIIAEAGVNHNGDFNLAKKMIKVAKKSGADAVKFQTWYDGELTGKFTQKVSYVKKNYKTNLNRYEISNKLKLSEKDFINLNIYAKKLKIDFLTTPCGFKSLNFIVNVLKVPFIKIGSSELNNYSYLTEVAKKNKIIFLSTGMSKLEEVEEAFRVIKRYNFKKLYILQCTSEYPCPSENLNLDVLKIYKKKFNNCGFSDHSLGFEASILSIGYGARVLEKHFTLSKKLRGPDHKASLNPKELRDYVTQIRKAELMIGDSEKKPTKKELEIMPQTRRGIVAIKKIKKNQTITRNLIGFKRPATGIKMRDIRLVIGKKTKKNLMEDEPIKLKYLKK